MTIEYKDSKRIVALSNDILDTVDYENTSAVSLGTGDSGTSIDLTGSTLDDSWTLRFKVTMTSLGTGSSLTFMVQNSTTTTVSTARDGIGLRQTDSANFYDFEGCDNVAGNAGQYDHRFTTTPATDTKYVQIKRISTTSAKIEFYDSTYTTVSESSGNIEIANITGLRYFVISNNGSALTVDDIDFWNGTVTNKPSDVQDNSLLVEKDTARRYWFDANPILDDDFSTDDWTDSGTNPQVTGGEMVWSVNSAVDANSYYALPITASNNSWVLRCKITINNYSLNTDGTGQEFSFGLSDETTIPTNSKDAIVFRLRTGSSTAQYQLIDVDGGSLSGGAPSQAFSRTLSAETIYVELIRTSTTTYKANIYSDSAYSILLESQSTTCPSTITNLRYINFYCLENDGTSNGTLDGICDDIEFYNGVTTASGGGFWFLPKLFEDFSTDNFSQTGTEIDVSGGELVWDAQPDGTTTGGYIDFGENLSDTAWVCRFKVQVNNYSGAVTTATNFFIQLQSITTVDSTTSRDSMGIHLRLKSGNTDWRVEAVDGSIAGGGAGNLIDGSATTETIYVQMYRDGNTIYAEWYDNANYTGTPTNTANHSSGTPVNLRYFAVYRRSDTTTTAVSNGIIDDLKIYNGVTSIN